MLGAGRFAMDLRIESASSRRLGSCEWITPVFRSRCWGLSLLKNPLSLVISGRVTGGDSGVRKRHRICQGDIQRGNTIRR